MSSPSRIVYLQHVYCISPSSATHLLPGTNGHIPQNFPIMTAHLSKLLCLPVSSQTVWWKPIPNDQVRSSVIWRQRWRDVLWSEEINRQV